MVAALAAGAAVFGIGGIAVADRGHDDGHHMKSFTIVERATTDTVVDNAPANDSIGDLIAFGNEVFDATNTTKVGTDQGSCVRTVVGKAYECSWTTMLEGGQITVEGPFLDAGDSTLAVTGGTGRYRKARGTMDLHARKADGSEYDFTFHLRG